MPGIYKNLSIIELRRIAILPVISLSLFFTLLSATLAISAKPSAAADKIAKSSIQLIHKPPTEKALPAPGQPMTLLLELAGTRDISLPVRLVLVRDGRLLPAPVTTSYRNASDRPVYEFELAAPLVELSYQFILPTAGAIALSTTRQIIRRPCVPALDSSSLGNVSKSELENLAVSAKVLEQEIESYSSALLAAESLQKEMNE